MGDAVMDGFSDRGSTPLRSTKKEGIASLLGVPSFFMKMKEAGLVSTRILSDRGAAPRWGAFSADRAGRRERLPSGQLKHDERNVRNSVFYRTTGKEI